MRILNNELKRKERRFLYSKNNSLILGRAMRSYASDYLYIQILAA